MRRILCALLVNTGARCNEFRLITFDDFDLIMKNRKINIFRYKQGKSAKIPVSDFGWQFLVDVQPLLKYLKTFFKGKYVFASIKCKDQPVHTSSLLRSFNSQLNFILKKNNIYLVITSHSFRITFLTALLKDLDIAKVREIIGHNHIETTNRYNRNTLSEKQLEEAIQAALAQMTQNTDN